MQLTNQIYTYYNKNKQLMSPDKQFHFATRLAAWRNDPDAFTYLREARDRIIEPTLPLADVLRKITVAPQTGTRNAHELRQPFFNKYPSLYGLHLALFRVRHLEAVYGIDARSALYEVASKESLEKLKADLINDDEAVKVLSTFAINFFYLLERVVNKDEDSLPIQHFYKLGKSYDTNNIEQLQLLIYLYTHCIIGESNFYTRLIPNDKLGIYTQMLQDLESLISKKFEMINLDNKLEFLVCARICSFDSQLTDRIYEEASRSISSEGTFVIDVHNQNTQVARNDFTSSEHRNVLFIMSASPYQPHSTLIG